MTTARQPITEERRRVFLETLARTGSVSAAAHAATPWSTGPHGGSEGFRDLAKRDPEFAAQVHAARTAALGNVEELIADHAINGTEKPIYYRGQQVGTERIFDHRLLLRLAAKLDPDWAAQRRVDASVAVSDGAGLDSMLSLTVEDLFLLPPNERQQLLALIAMIEERQRD